MELQKITVAKQDILLSLGSNNGPTTGLIRFLLPLQIHSHFCDSMLEQTSKQMYEVISPPIQNQQINQSNIYPCCMMKYSAYSA